MSMHILSISHGIHPASDLHAGMGITAHGKTCVVNVLFMYTQDRINILFAVPSVLKVWLIQVLHKT